MSNALGIAIAAAAPTSRPDMRQITDLSAMMTTLCGIGIVVLLVWLGHGLIKPSKFNLSTSPGRRNTLTPIHLLAVLFATILCMSIIASILLIEGRLDELRIKIVSGIALPITGMILGLLVARYSFHNGAVGGMGFTRRRWMNDSVRGAVTLLAILPVCMILLGLTTRLLMHYRPDLIVVHPYLDFMTSAETPMFWRVTAILAAVVAAPLGEEVFFRGLLQSMFRRYLGRPWPTIVITSFAFAVIHYPIIQSMPALFALALALGYSYERTGRLHAPILIHTLFNAVMIAETLISGLQR